MRFFDIIPDSEVIIGGPRTTNCTLDSARPSSDRPSHLYSPVAI